MHSLYPSIKPYAQHELKVSELHTLYLEETGNPEGLPVVVLHPGPGASTGDGYLRRFLIRNIIELYFLINADAGALLLIWKFVKIRQVYYWMISMPSEIF